MNLFIRNFPNDLHRKLKAQAAEGGLRLYEIVIKILKDNFSRPKGESENTLRR